MKQEAGSDYIWSPSDGMPKILLYLCVCSILCVIAMYFGGFIKDFWLLMNWVFCSAWPFIFFGNIFTLHKAYKIPKSYPRRHHVIVSRILCASIMLIFGIYYTLILVNSSHIKVIRDVLITGILFLVYSANLVYMYFLPETTHYNQQSE